MNKNFNSHAHVERDINQQSTNNNETISTHTLTWSVTIYNIISTQKIEFQLTRSRGA